MNIHRILPLAGMLLGLGLTADAIGDDRLGPDQLRRQARELQAKAAELERANKLDAAELTARKARALLEQAEKLERVSSGDRVEGRGEERKRSDRDREFAQWLRQQELRLRQLREQGKAEEAEELRRRVERVLAARRRGHRPARERVARGRV